MEILPSIDLLGGRVVRLLRGKEDTAKVYSDDPVEAALRWEREGADLLHVVDLDAAFGHGSNSGVIAALCRCVKVPLQVAGGIRSSAAALEWADRGVARVVIGTMAFESRRETEILVEKLGMHRVVAALDHLGGELRVKGWTQPAGMRLEPAIEQLLDQGLNHFLVTAIERDGAMSGPDLPSLAGLCADPRCRIIASGGVSTLDDVATLRRIGAAGAIIGKALYEGRISLTELCETSS